MVVRQIQQAQKASKTYRLYLSAKSNENMTTQLIVG